MTNVSKVIKIPAYQTLRFKEKIRPLFENTGIPNYFLAAADIPSQLMDMDMPENDYWLLLEDAKVSRIDVQRRKILFPSVQQVLWAVGWMNIELANAVAERPIRFLHKPFRAHMCPWKRNKDVWRQLCIKLVDGHYSLETVCVQDPFQDMFLGYVLPT